MIRVDPKKAAEIERRIAAARGKSTKELLLELADAVIREPVKLAPLPGLARWWSEQMAQKAQNPGHLIEQSRGKAARLQWETWSVRVYEDLVRDGVRLLAEIRAAAPSELARFDQICARVAALIRAIRELSLPWWPVYRIDEAEGNVELSVVDFAQRELGRLEGWQIRAGGAGAALPLFVEKTREPASATRSSARIDEALREW